MNKEAPREQPRVAEEGATLSGFVEAEQATLPEARADSQEALVTSQPRGRTLSLGCSQEALENSVQQIVQQVTIEARLASHETIPQKPVEAAENSNSNAGSSFDEVYEDD